VGRCRLDASVSGYGPVMNSVEYGNEPLDSTKGGNFLDYLSDCKLLKKDSTSWSLSVNHKACIFLLMYIH